MAKNNKIYIWRVVFLVVLVYTSLHIIIPKRETPQKIARAHISLASKAYGFCRRVFRFYFFSYSCWGNKITKTIVYSNHHRYIKEKKKCYRFFLFSFSYFPPLASFRDWLWIYSRSTHIDIFFLNSNRKLVLFVGFISAFFWLDVCITFNLINIFSYFRLYVRLSRKSILKKETYVMWLDISKRVLYKNILYMVWF